MLEMLAKMQSVSGVCIDLAADLKFWIFLLL